jgi:Lrp/AsnC family transcriptional regulator, leucine-responsive regulatory protein
MIDAIDRKILNILQQNARTSNAQIARDLGMAPSAILERIRKLEASGVIQGYEARIDPEALGLHLLAYVSVRSEDLTLDNLLGAQLAEIPAVQEVHHIAGDDCFLVKVRTADAKALGRLLRERFSTLGSVRTRTIVVLDSLSETGRLPIDLPAEPALAPRETSFEPSLELLDRAEEVPARGIA